MSENTPRIWQIACGESGRRYDDLFLKYDVMFLGPSDPGRYDDTTYQSWCEDRKISKDEWHRVARFAGQVHAGDFVIARRGKLVMAVGIVVDDDYHHDMRFDDIHGWDVSHYRRVAWAEDVSAELESMQQNEPLFSHMRQIKTFTQADARVREKVAPLLTDCVLRDLKELPKEPPKILDPDQLAERLFQRGVSYDAVARVCQTIEKVRRLVRWYGESEFDDYRPTEREVVAHIILPIMLALGWSEQLLAIEWGRRDLAAFRATPTIRENCKLIVEAKAMYDGLQDVFEQARSYTKNLPNCDKVLVTNGMRNYLHFSTYEDGVHIWDPTPSNYFNLRKLRENHTCYPGTNAVDAIVALTPAHVAQ